MSEEFFKSNFWRLIMNLIVKLKTLAWISLAIIVGSLTVITFNQPTIIQGLKFIESAHFFDYEVDWGYGLSMCSLSQTAIISDRESSHKSQDKINATREDQDKKYITQSLNFLMRLGEVRTSFFVEFMFFIYFFPALIFMGLKTKKTLDARYHAKLRKLSKKSSKLEKQKQNLQSFAIALKTHDTKKTNILEKIFLPNETFREIQELYFCCSQEVLENFKAQIKTQVETQQHSSFSLTGILVEIKDSFSYKIMNLHISFKVRGHDILLQGIGPSVYFVLYYTIKKIMDNLSKNGRIEVSLTADDSMSCIIIKDNGYLFSEEKVKHFQLLLNKRKQEFPVAPSYEDISHVAKICGWRVNKKGREGDFNITEIVLSEKKPSSINSNVIYLKDVNNPVLT